jgi:hypothetical protein
MITLSVIEELINLWELKEEILLKRNPSNSGRWANSSERISEELLHLYTLKEQRIKDQFPEIRNCGIKELQIIRRDLKINNITQ